MFEKLTKLAKNLFNGKTIAVTEEGPPPILPPSPTCKENIFGEPESERDILCVFAKPRKKKQGKKNKHNIRPKHLRGKRR